MSPIARSVFDALERVSQDRYEGALRDICGAVEGTLKKAGLGGRSNYKEWVAGNLDLLLAVSFPGFHTKQLRIAYAHPALPVSDPPEVPTLEEIIYHVVRCELYHVGGLPSNVTFAPGTIGGATLGRSLVLPSEFVLGLVLSVIASQENKLERLDGEPILICNRTALSLNLFWGKKQQLLDSLAFARAAAGLLNHTRNELHLRAETLHG